MASSLRKRLFGSAKSRAAAESSIGASAVIAESSPFESTANSAGASTNLVEISENLDQLLARIEEDEILQISQENIANRLWEICETYEESKVPATARSWSCDDPTFRLTVLAAQCSEMVYGRKVVGDQAQPEPQVIKSWETIESSPASLDGSIKASLLGLDMESKTLVVAFRGSKVISPIDWITNLNGNAVDAQGFLPRISNAEAHAGFLYVASNMAQKVHDAINSQSGKYDKLLFTGHSAGGAVAALLFSHFCLNSSIEFERSYCITFGAPPVISPQIGSHTLGVPEINFLSLVNKGDPVPRGDKPYIQQLLEIYVEPKPEKSFISKSAELFCPGTIILLHDLNPDSVDEEVDAVDATEILPQLLFGNVKVHRMREYLRLIKMWDECRRKREA